LDQRQDLKEYSTRKERNDTHGVLPHSDISIRAQEDSKNVDEDVTALGPETEDHLSRDNENLATDVD
jgi:hypothetical protein